MSDKTWRHEMMIGAQEFRVRAGLEIETLSTWVETRWLLPVQDKEELSFSELDLARAHFIRDLKNDLGVNDDGVEIILNLVDQIHGLRHALGKLSAAPKIHPETRRLEASDNS